VSRFVQVILVGAIVTGGSAYIGQAANPQAVSPPIVTSIDQKIDSTTLRRYHHSDQGTRIMPAAFLQSLRTADGTSRIMSADNFRKWGFLVDGVQADALNPYGWPIGFTVSDPAVSKGIPVAGVTCALCHTGELVYHGQSIRIEGGQANVNLPEFQAAVYAGLLATAKDPARSAALVKDAVALGYPAQRAENDFRVTAAAAQDLLYGQKGLTGTNPGPGRVDAVQGIANAVFATDLKVPSNARNFDAPVSYPYLWDIWRLTWLQYNGFLPPQALSRNIGETLGVSGKTNIVNPTTGTLNPVPLRWETSIQFNNLLWMESVLEKLKAPMWPEGILGSIDRTKAAGGRQLFTAHCAGCHGIKELPSGNWDVSVIPLSVIDTDPNQATNWAARTYDASKLGLGKAVTASSLGPTINAIRTQFYADSKTPASRQEPDVKLESPCGYKARPLIGVWATPPFLHNGSVRTIFDLLSDERPASFKFGSREYDPVHLGYVEDSTASGVLLDSSLSGNHNTGHWFTDDAARPGKIGPKLSDGEKYAILEYLKSATYENYPTMKVDHQRPLPCGNNPNWAAAKTGDTGAE
jgi:hypothetical protein